MLASATVKAYGLPPAPYATCEVKLGEIPFAPVAPVAPVAPGAPGDPGKPAVPGTLTKTGFDQHGRQGFGLGIRFIVDFHDKEKHGLT